MGLFDDLKKAAKGIGNIDVGKIANTVGKAVGNTAGSVVKSGHESPYPSSQNSGASSHYNNSVNTNLGSSPDANIDHIFNQILAAEFSDLKIIKNATPESVGITAPHPCRPYSYALLRNGKAAVVIMLTPHNRDRNSAFLNAKKSALDSNVKFLNFYTHFVNEHNYVVTRIRSAL